MVNQRVAGRPLEHILGWADFCGRRIIVDLGIFIPRRRTELLVHQAASVARCVASRSSSRPVVIVELCCGSGAIATVLALGAGRVKVYAADIDPAAVQCARRNLEPIGGRVYEGDLYQALPAKLRGRVDVLVANAPYVPTNVIELLPTQAQMHEPRVALDGGPDGLELQRRVAAAAPQWLAPGGRLLIETSQHQLPQTIDILARAGLSTRVARCQDLEATVVIGSAQDRRHTRLASC
jgi:release factor glutamine methyltransferase